MEILKIIGWLMMMLLLVYGVFAYGFFLIMLPKPFSLYNKVLWTGIGLGIVLLFYIAIKYHPF